ncbi:helix-turn-helix domain-containing protein [Bacillus idriensis]|uniref:Helix-turn-helix domain-containing protein n=1 Tax=Metabacillus idriensis TaxID=324768 RepID=A0A6I2M8Y5_9BACI|nr:helix-turn-helix transcriptional regulator [Metabacillus idriensis]MRX54795.1 helix-turn-helix domain-containing protein [Metabacillus idriensis]
MKTFGDRLKELRKEINKSQKEFGKVFDLSESTIGMYERNERKPDYDTLIKIADFFEVSTDYLLKGEDFRTQAEKLLNDPDMQIAARDGDMSKEKAMDAIAWLLEQEKGRKPGDKQNRRK